MTQLQGFPHTQSVDGCVAIVIEAAAAYVRGEDNRNQNKIDPKIETGTNYNVISIAEN